MTDERIEESFEEHRAHLRSVAYRMLGSLAEADDAVQEAWLRLARADPREVRSLRAWLTTVVARICLDMLRVRRARAEQPLDEVSAGASAIEPVDPEQEALLADSVGVALLVVLQTLSPAERLAFVLHDMFDVPFARIAPMVGRSESTAAQLAARARRRVRGKTTDGTTDLVRQHRLVTAFLAAARDGDFEALLALLDSDVVLRVDAAAAGSPTTIRGAHAVATNAQMFSQNARSAQTALVDGKPGIVVAPAGRLTLVLNFGISDETITDITIEADPNRLADLELAVLS